MDRSIINPIIAPIIDRPKTTQPDVERTSPRIRLLLLIPHLGGGGAERVISLLATHLNPQRFEIHLALLTPDRSGTQQLPPSVTIHRIGVRRVRQAWLSIIRLIWKIRPHVLLSGIAHLNFLILLIKPFLPRSTRVVVRQSTTASQAATSRLSQLAYHLLYPRADIIVCQSEAMAADLNRSFAIPQSKLALAHNPIEIEAIRAALSGTSRNNTSPWQTNASPRLLAIGRLAHEKGFDLLLTAIATLKSEYPDLQLVILGEGPARASLQQQIDSLQLNRHVLLPGYAKPIAYYAETTIFILSSRLEGMPNSLLEAAAAGLPLVATPCCDGLSDLLKNATGVWTASDVSAPALTHSLRLALASLTPHGDSPQRFHHTFIDPFALNNSIAAYEALLFTLATRGRA